MLRRCARFVRLARPPWLVPPLLALAAVALLAACGNSASSAPTPTPTSPAIAATTPSTPAGAAFPLRVSGADGVAIALAAAPQRIVSYSPGATEILFAIGAGPRVVAVDHYSNYPQAAQSLPHLDTYLDTTDPEQALARSPDLIVTTIAAQAKQFRALGVPALLLAIPGSIDGVYGDMQLLGTATGHAGEAATLIADTQRRINAAVQRVGDVAQGPKVFLELDSTLYTAAPGSFIGSMLERLRARNVAAGSASPFPQLTAEAVIAANPDVILLHDATYGESLQTVAARPGWSTIAAVRNGRVIAIDEDIVSRPGPRIADAVEALVRALYPERFAASAPGTAR